ncbi:alpha-N-arabinofuranosidase [Bacteroidota bacterium]
MKSTTTIGIFLLISTFTLSAQNTLHLHLDEAETKINKEIYGHFAEHLGRCIYGGIFVGEDSEIPNIRGYRSDVIEALQEMEIPLLRWPGGCFADTYHWKDGIGPRETRPSIVNTHWGGVTEDNSFGTHEFLEFCELIGAMPYISMNLGSGTVQEAAEWVEYVTSSSESPMTDLRKQNGREDPWNVKYWGIGNENWGCGGHMTPEYYTDLYLRFATYCGGAKFKIAGGPSVDDYNWTDVLMKKTKRHQWLVNGISLHNYSFAYSWGNKGEATGFGEADYFATMKDVQRMKTLLTRHIAIMDQYDPSNRVGLMVDEWGNWWNVEKGTNPGFLYQQNTMRDAVTASINLNDFNNYAHRVKMANIAQMVNVLQAVILTKEEELVKTPTFYIFKMYTVHHDATLIPSNLKTEDYVFNGEKVPAISSSASIKDGDVNITLSNAKAAEDVEIEITLTGQDFKKAEGQIITSKNIDDYNDFGRAEKVSLKDFDVPDPKKGKFKLLIPAHSVVLVNLN